MIAAARELYVTTDLSTRMIAARVKATAERVAHWARRHGWTRPSEQADPHGRVGRRPRGRRIPAAARRSAGG